MLGSRVGVCSGHFASLKLGEMMGFWQSFPVLLVFALSACSEGQGTSNDGPSTGDERSGPPCPTSFEEVATQVFQQSCIGAGCHGSAEPAGGLDLETSALELELFGQEAALCDGEVRIVPGDSTSSYLISKLRGAGCGAQMPINELS